MHVSSPAQPTKTTLFGGGNQADVRKMAAGHFSNRVGACRTRFALTHLGCSRQKPRFLAAATKPMSEKWPQAIFPID